MHANNDPTWRPIYLPFCGADRREGLLEFASRQTGFPSSGRIVIVGPIHRKCPGVEVVAVDKIAERCNQATESLSSDRSRRRAGDRMPKSTVAIGLHESSEESGPRQHRSAGASGSFAHCRTRVSVEIVAPRRAKQ
jgi:hypothetical protein